MCGAKAKAVLELEKYLSKDYKPNVFLAAINSLYKARA